MQMQGTKKLPTKRRRQQKYIIVKINLKARIKSSKKKAPNKKRKMSKRHDIVSKILQHHLHLLPYLGHRLYFMLSQNQGLAIHWIMIALFLL